MCNCLIYLSNTLLFIKHIAHTCTYSFIYYKNISNLSYSYYNKHVVIKIDK